MARGGMMQRVEALEQQVGGGFAGFAPIDIWPGQTVEQAKASWEADNGPVGNRWWIVWNFGGCIDASA